MESIKLHLHTIFNLPGGPLGYAAYFVANQLKPLPLPTADFTGKTAIVTGANVGLGLEAARHLVRLGAARVILGCRSSEKAEAARRDIEATTGRHDVVEAWPLDLGSFDSVREFCGRAAELDRLDLVIENAGVATEVLEMMEGYESTIATNVVSTFLMALLLLPALRATAARFNVEPHLVVVSSDAHLMASFVERSDPEIFATYRREETSADRYNTSKLLEVLMVRELAAQMDAKGGGNPIVLNSLNPGLCRSSLFRHAAFPLNLVINTGLFLLGRTAEMGSRTLLAAAFGGRETHGKHMDNCKVNNPSPFVMSEEGARVQKKVYAELMDILESIQPGISSHV